MSGFSTTEGDAMMASAICMKVTTDRPADLWLGLFTNSAATSAITFSTVTQPTGTGYALITLTDASWTGAAAIRSYAKQTFTAGAGGFTGSIYGYFIATKSGGTQRVIWMEIDPAGPYTMASGDTYDVTPSVTFA